MTVICKIKHEDDDGDKDTYLYKFKGVLFKNK